VPNFCHLILPPSLLMLILSLVYYLVPCLAFTDYVGKWVDIPFFPLESSIQSPFGLALRQSEVTCPPTGGACHNISFLPPLFSHLILAVLCTDMTNCCPHGSSCVRVVVNANAVGFYITLTSVEPLRSVVVTILPPW